MLRDVGRLMKAFRNPKMERRDEKVMTAFSS